jgi:hypothetical protein
MKVKVDTSGLDKLRKRLKEASKPESVSLTELMPDSFIKAYTEYETLQAMFDAGGVESADYLQTDEWNEFVAAHTQFTDWSDMLKKAGALRLKNKLGL